MDVLYAYLKEGLGPIFSDLGFDWKILENPVEGGGPFLIAERIENPTSFTILSYGHADVVEGMDGQWPAGRNPFQLSETPDRFYGRGTADNKGQHLLNLMALQEVLATKEGQLGFNCKFLIETSEEIGSVGLEEFVTENKSELFADVLIASDGPRVAPDLPTLVLGLRGAMNFSLEVSVHSEAHHSGNWGGIISDPCIVLANALSAICSVSGVIQVPAWRPKTLADSDRQALAGCPFDPGETDDMPDDDWGEPDLTLWERLALWPSFSVLAVEHGNPRRPTNAIYPKSTAYCSIRFPASLDPKKILDGLQEFLDAEGHAKVKVVRKSDDAFLPATKGDPEGYWASMVAHSIEKSVMTKARILPSNGGSLPNHVFAEILGLETIWIPHSYTACQQHAPNEHIRKDILRSAMRIMNGLWWDIAGVATLGREASDVLE
jgi:acetylornithine deacetylase/succinyl-diaminopimelate desuccinylase-like protein